MQRLNGNIVRLIRANTQLTQKQFAGFVGISRSLLSSIEIGAKPITKSVERRIREAFGLDDDKINQLTNNALYSVTRGN